MNNNLPELPDEIVSLIYDFIRPKLGFEFKKKQIFKCDGFYVEITDVKRRPFYNEIYINGYRCFPEEKCGFATTIPITNKYKDMCIDKSNFIGFEISKEMLIN
tara:strand:- start:296 stop:604 length:309 start_codon:yes stop_codon:yes gene_type:complete